MSNLKNNKISRFFLYSIAFLMAFCSLSYELIIATRISRMLGEGMLVYPFCLAVFIMAMGLGSGLWFYKSKKMKKDILDQLISIELVLTFLGSISIIGINFILYDSLYMINLQALVLGLFIAFLIGFFSGQELPLLFQYCSYLKYDHKEIRRIIFFDYTASLFASMLCALVFFTQLGLFKTSILIAFINLLIAIILIGFSIYQKKQILAGGNIIVLIFLLLFMGSVPYLDSFENRMLTWTYLGERNIVLLEKRNTVYQQVLLFLMRQDNEPISTSIEEVSQNKKGYYLLGVLNGSLQFIEPVGAKADPDHTLLIDPYVHLLDDVQDVLILGGGDGLPARQIVKYDSLKSITMIDLDQQWVEFSKTNSFMRLQNADALNNPRINIIYKDAFKWVLSTQKKYDLILVDFPSESTSLAKVRTLSIQFLKDLHRILKSNGAIVLHNNSLTNPLKEKLIWSTGLKAGLFPLFGYKENQPPYTETEQKVFFKDRLVRDSFLNLYEKKYKKDKSNRLAREFGYMDFYMVEPSESYISFYDPLVSSLPWEDQKIMFKEILP